MHIKTAPNGKVYLNIGCGNRFSPDWNNLDLIQHPNVTRWDIRKGLPFPDNSIDFAYSSHVLEHMTRPQARRLIKEIYRVLKPGGVVRTAVPDIEGISREYLKNLEAYRTDPSEKNLFRYKWIMLELLDQMTRTVGGGEMRKTLDGEIVDPEYLRSRIGDAATSIKKDLPQHTGLKRILSNIRAQWRAFKNRPDKIGELHRWMYDRTSIDLLFKEFGFQTVGSKTFNDSTIEDWKLYDFDASTKHPNVPRKPDSLYYEAKKTV